VIDGVGNGRRRVRDRFEQPDALIVVERVDAQTGLVRNLLDGACCFHRQEYETRRTLQVKSLRASNGDRP